MGTLKGTPCGAHWLRQHRQAGRQVAEGATVPCSRRGRTQPSEASDVSVETEVLKLRDVRTCT